MQEAFSNLAYAGGQGEFVHPATTSRRAALVFETAVVCFVILDLIAAELILASAIRGNTVDSCSKKMPALPLKSPDAGDLPIQPDRPGCGQGIIEGSVGLTVRIVEKAVSAVVVIPDDHARAVDAVGNGPLVSGEGSSRAMKVPVIHPH